ncbi:MAG: hypothetical protein HEQ29_10835 [Dolichospermum sp. LBC05a]|nr:hypothetical protein [Dolichospermum sp. OL01]MCO5797241.1 hypothetical protein [Dolichospermum sp. OL03]MCS6280863.1 hypothetical protein [Dolichospermum sp.]QSV58776.1 MAG: hypothetical protein HEQ29_10835 [Dolichospermum sp. LBC05a]
MLDTVRQWQGTAESLTEELNHQIKELKLSVEIPAVRTVRLWRSKNIFSQPQKQRFGFRQILEGLATVLLLKKGWTLAAISQVLPSLSDINLERQILAEAESQETTWIPDSFVKDHRQQIDLAENAVVLLAQGIIRLYQQISHDQEIVKIVKQDDNLLPGELYQGMCKLGRLYIENGQIDQAASVHQILNLARFPLKNAQWNLPIFQQPEFSYRDVILIDSQLCVPTNDCETIAHNYGGFGENNLIERRLYNSLKESTEKLASRRQHLAYTKIRELLGRFSLIGQRKLLDYVEEHDLTPLQRVISEFFIEVPDIWLIKNFAHRCADCGTLMRPHYQKIYPNGQCPIVQCPGHLNPKIGEKLDPNKDQLLVAKPQILTYWTAPAIDELAIYDIAKKEGLEVELYPNSDICDIGINNRFIGIDAKSYSSPVALAAKLNHSIGGLIHYTHRIIAISDRLIIDNPYYLDIVREKLEPKNPQSTLQIMSVSEIIQKLKERYYEN